MSNASARTLSGGKLALWYAAAIAIGTYGSWDAYHGHFSSDAWTLWAAASAKGVDPTILDVLRLFVAAVHASRMVSSADWGDRLKVELTADSGNAYLLRPL